MALYELSGYDVAMLAVCAVLLLAGGEPPDVAALLSRAGARVFGMEGFSVLVRQDRADGRAAPAVRIDRGSMNRWRIDHGIDGSYWVSDGLKWVVVIGADRAYREASEGPMARGMVAFLSSRILRFEQLAGLASQGRFVRYETLRDGAREIRCAVIDVHSNSPANPWRDRLWIEPESALIWQSEFDARTLTPAVQTGPGAWAESGTVSRSAATRTRYDWISVDRRVREDLFDATPPKGYRRLSPP